MERKPENLPLHELIGLKAEIVDAKDPNMEGITGKVVDETMKTLEIMENDGNTKVIPKKDVKLVFSLEEDNVQVDGEILQGRPEERTTKKIPGKWSYKT